MKRIVKPAALCLALLAIAPAAFADDGLTESQRFISHPFMSRAWQAATREDWQEVESVTRFLLERVPANQDARALLVDALARQGRYGEALQEAASLADSAAVAALVFETRMRWIAQQDPGAERVSGWLADTAPERRTRLWQAYSMALQERQGPDAARAWLASLGGVDAIALARWRGVFDELRGDSQGVVRELSPLLDSRSLNDEDWRRLGLAYARLGDPSGLERVLAVAPSAAAATELRRIAAERAIAAGQPRQALRWLAPLEKDASQSDQMVLWELGRQSGDVGLVERTADALRRPCLETAEWLQRRDRVRARARLEACDPAEDPQRWLVLAERVGDVELLAGRRLPAPWTALQQERVVALWRASGEPRRALRWLDTQPVSPPQTKLRAEVLQSLGDAAAADAWLTYYRQTGDADALDQASFLLVRQSREREARALLEEAFSRHPERLRARSVERLVTLVIASGSVPDQAFVQRVLPRLPRAERAQVLVRLADAGRCDAIAGWIPQGDRLAAEEIALARCADPKRPGVAVVHYRAAIQAGAVSERRALAYALQASGDDAGAYAIWREQPLETLGRDDRLAAARSALGVAQLDVADTYWRSLSDTERETSAEVQRLGAVIALARGQDDLALQRERKAIALAPTAANYYDAAGTAFAVGEPEAGLEWLGRSVELDANTPRYRLDYALRLAAHEQRRMRLAAIPHLERARVDYPADIRVPEALSLRYMEQGKDVLARPAMRDAIDLQQDALMVATETPAWLADRRYAMRRAHETQARRDSRTLASTWSPYSVAGADQPVAGQNYQVAMWDHLLEDQDGNATNRALYGRVLTSGPSRSDYGDAMGIGLGMRVKPWQDQNINLYAELYYERNLDQGGGRGADLLLRATASFLDQGEYRNDWRPTESVWSERSLYLDAAWFVREHERLLLLRYQHGRTFKLPLAGAHTLMPYVMVQGSALDDRQDLRMGVGVRWQSWIKDDHYSAYRGRFSVRAEYQQGLSGSLYDREGGWMIGMELNW
ncbi:MAG: hypothetical protein LPJ91_11270 [Pseudazoarcus pumilus]|nr:hypothetical protein [Pseudazoarcus pumilus]